MAADSSRRWWTIAVVLIATIGFGVAPALLAAPLAPAQGGTGLTPAATTTIPAGLLGAASATPIGLGSSPSPPSSNLVFSSSSPTGSDSLSLSSSGSVSPAPFAAGPSSAVGHFSNPASVAFQIHPAAPAE